MLGFWSLLPRKFLYLVLNFILYNREIHGMRLILLLFQCSAQITRQQNVKFSFFPVLFLATWHSCLHSGPFSTEGVNGATCHLPSI